VKEALLDEPCINQLESNRSHNPCATKDDATNVVLVRCTAIHMRCHEKAVHRVRCNDEIDCCKCDHPGHRDTFPKSYYNQSKVIYEPGGCEYNSFLAQLVSLFCFIYAC